MKKEDKVFNSSVKYGVAYRNVKYPRLEFRTGMLNLILPQNYKGENRLLQSHKKWILSKDKAIKQAIKLSKNKKIKEKTEEEFKKFALDYHEKHSKIAKARKVSFKKMKSKWGSCSSKGVLTFNTLMRFLPKHLIEYVVFHEMMHIKERKHNQKFWSLISKKYKNYKAKEKDLFIYWFLIQNRIK